MSSALPPQSPKERLESWKEIADYLNKGVTTVRRWEREEGLPVRRQEHIKRGSVIAYKEEIDEWLRSRTSPLPEEAPPQPPVETGPAVRSNRVWWVAVPAALLTALIGYGVSTTGAGDSGPKVAGARMLTADPGMEDLLTFAPGGERFAYGKDGQSIRVKQVGVEPARLFYKPADKEVCCPKWSPDGRWIAVARYTGSAAWDIVLVDARTGVEGKRVRGGPGMTWRRDSAAILFSEGVPVSVHEWEPGSGRITQLTFPPPGFWGDIASAVSPDGKQLAFLRYPVKGNGDIHVSNYGGREARRITFTENWVTGLDWVDRYVLFAGTPKGKSGALYLVTADGSGQPVLIEGTEGRATYPQAVRLESELWRVGFTVDAWTADIMLYDPAAGKARAIAVSTEPDEYPALSEDGRIVFQSDRGGLSNLWVCEGDCGAPRQITQLGGENGTMHPRWSSGGTHIVFAARIDGEPSILVIDSQGRAQRVVTRGFEAGAPAWSADGKSIFYRSSRSGRVEIWRIGEMGGEAVQVTSGGGLEAFPSADGRFLYFIRVAEMARLMRRDLQNGTEIEVAGIPVLREGRWTVGGNSVVYVDAARGLLCRWEPETRRTTILGPAPEPIGISANGAGQVVWGTRGPVEANLRAVDLRLPNRWLPAAAVWR